MTDEGGERGLMAATATGYKGDVGFGREVGFDVDYLAREIARYRGIGEGDGGEGRVDEMGRVVDEVFCYVG
jgi:hypothetical protein